LTPVRPSTQPPGFTLLEMMITLAVIAVLATVASPSMSSMLNRQRLKAAASHLQADIAMARQEAGRLDQAVTVQFQAGDPWCYSVSTGGAVDCRLSRTPDGHRLIKRVQAPDYPGITLLQASPMVLGPQTGHRLDQLASGHARFASREGEQLQVRLGPLGRASLCVPAAPLLGLPPCPAEAKGS
jgi:type IV fimbrial biogenesis protein FimT